MSFTLTPPISPLSASLVSADVTTFVTVATAALTASSVEAPLPFSRISVTSFGQNTNLSIRSGTTNVSIALTTAQVAQFIALLTLPSGNIFQSLSLNIATAGTGSLTVVVS